MYVFVELPISSVESRRLHGHSIPERRVDLDWSPWIPFPAPELGRLSFPAAPLAAGVYELRHRKDGRLILFGRGKECAKRMRSLAPAPWGVGTRNNTPKRDYVQEHWIDIDYRTIVCTTETEAKAFEKELKRTEIYIFHEQRVAIASKALPASKR